MPVLKSFCLALFISLLSPLMVHAAEKREQRIYAVYWRGCEESCQGLKDYMAQHLPNTELIIRDAGRRPERLHNYLAEARALQARPDPFVGYQCQPGTGGTDE